MMMVVTRVVELARSCDPGRSEKVENFRRK